MRASPAGMAASAAARAAVHGLMLMTILFVAGSFPVGAAITHALDPAVLTLVRFLLAVAVFAPIVAIQYGLSRPTIGDLGRYAALSGSYVAFFWCMFTALRYTSALNTGALFTLVPGISAVYGAVLVRERLGGGRLLALVVGMVGALWVVFRGDPDRVISLAFNTGDMIFLAGCFAFAFYTPLVKLLHRGEPMAVMTFWTLVTGSAWLALMANARIWTTDWSAVSPSVIAGIAYLAILTTIVSFFVLQYSTLRLGPTRVMAYTYLIPAFVLLIDWTTGQGLPPPMTLPGVAIILVTMVIVQRGAERDQGT